MKALTAPAPTDLAQWPGQTGHHRPDRVGHCRPGSPGKSAGEGVVYAKDLSRPMVFTVESALADELKKPADDFRVRTSSTRGPSTRRVSKSSETPDAGVRKDKDAWKQVTPSAKAADTAKVEALLTALTNTRHVVCGQDRRHRTR